MQPDDQNNHWKQEPDETDSNKITDMYTPEPDTEDEQSDDSGTAEQQSPDNNEPIHWEASEYIDNEKDSIWYIIFAIIVLGFILVDFLFLKAYTFSALVIVMAISIIVFSRRPARIVDYTLSGSQGLYIGEKLCHFSEFKAFGLINDHGQNSVVLIPTKRFLPSVSVYFPQEVGEELVDILGARLPMETLKLDLIDNIVRRLRL